MKTREQREQELYSSGLVDSIKNLLANKQVNFSEKYYVLIADYLDSLDEVKDSMLINPEEIARRLPEVITNIRETNLNGIYGITNENGIQIEQSLNYESQKLYFFHELTHALQTRNENDNDNEICAFYNGHDGMFLTEGATQYTAEMLYHVSNGTDLNNRQQLHTVRGDSDRITYSPLSEYQYNGDILMLLSKSMDLPLPQVLALAYKENGREVLKNIYESMEGNQGKFDNLMQDLEKIYSIDKLIISGLGNSLQNQTPINITMQDRVTTFEGNLDIYKELMNKTERELAATFIENHDSKYILQNYEEFSKYLTTPELKQQFLEVVQELVQGDMQNNRSEASRNEQMQGELEFPEGYSINEYGEIIRPQKQEIQENVSISNNMQLSLKQKIAQMLQKNNLLMNIPFVEKFVSKQLNVLQPAQQEIVSTTNTARQNLVNRISNNGEYRNLPPIQRMSDPEKIEQMRRKMEQQQQSNEDDGR